MKLNKWLYGATALAMLAACSDKDILPDSGGNTNEEGSGFIGVRIQLPTAPSTRATTANPDLPGNDNFDDGVSSEYKLDDAVLVLFQGDSEANAQCVGAFELKRSQTHGDDNASPQITTQVTRVANVTGVSLSENNDLYALVITNGIANGLLSATDLPDVSWMQKDGKGKTIKDFQEYITENQLYSLDGNAPGEGYASSIVMTNSPLAEKKGTGTEPQGGLYDPGSISGPLPVLVKLNNHVYETEADALKKPAGIIHVERAVGKITCSKFEKTTGLTLKYNGEDYKLTVKDIWWDMAQDMKKTYLVRNTNRIAVADQAYNHRPGADQSNDNMWMWNYKSAKVGSLSGEGNGPYRMIGHTAINSKEIANDGTEIAKTFYRPYFCQVPGYGKAMKVTVLDDDGKPVLGEDGKETKRASSSREDKSFNKTEMYFDEDNPPAEWTTDGAFYPRENTFPVEFMKYANTTRIGFWVTFKFVNTKDNSELDLGKTNDFFTKGLDKSTIYVRNNKGCDPLTAAVIDELNKNDKVKQAVENAIDKVNNTTWSYSLEDLLEFTYNQEKLNKSGEIWIDKIAFKDKDVLNKMEGYEDLFKATPTLEGSGYAFKDDYEDFNNLDQVYIYKGGRTFYEVRIKHFGDDLTPWTAGPTASTIDQSYGPATDITSFRTRNANYLGRYGIVRNNWYDLQINNITRLGDPQDPAKWDGSWPGKPDDNKDEYIAVVLRVLSWAKRTQSVIF